MYNPKEDPAFQKPYIDVEEERIRKGIKLCYIHGGFSNTNVKFSFYFPEKGAYEGRFYQFLSPFPGPDEEMASMPRTGLEDHITFALTHGAYFVETNMGSGSAFDGNEDPTMLYRSSAVCAEYSRETARRLYGCDRPYGYVYGGSGGGYKTCGCIENTTAFDGAVPFVTACPVALPNIMTVTAHARRILRNKLDWIADALKPGCDHDIVSGLNEEEREAFEEVCKMGVPKEAWIGMKQADEGGFAVIGPMVRMIDPQYYEDYWTKPGYLGTEKNSSAVRDRICFTTKIKTVYIPQVSGQAEEQNDKAVDGRNGVDTAWQKMIMSSGNTKPYIEPENLSEHPFDYLFGLKVQIISGKAKGQELSICSVKDGKLVIEKAFGEGSLEECLAQIDPGDEICIDNSDYIAVQTYHRHQVPEAEYKAWDQFRNPDGTPKYPQRKDLLCYGFAYQGAGAIQSGDIQGKVIMVNCLADGGACTWMSDWYRKKVTEKFGGETDCQYRLWCMEHCGHTDQEHTNDPLHVPSYLGALYRALIDVAAWVERGVEPAKTSGYVIENGQPQIPETAEERKGIQPVVSVLANGEKRACISVGENVMFTATVGLPDEKSEIQSVEWSFEGEAYQKGETSVYHSYQKAGTYFAVVRVISNRGADPFTGVQNIDRVRVIVK